MLLAERTAGEEWLVLLVRFFTRTQFSLIFASTSPLPILRNTFVMFTAQSTVC